jgi:hypothetical protein
MPSFEYLVKPEQQVEISIHGIFPLHKGSLPIEFTAADSQPDF